MTIDDKAREVNAYVQAALDGVLFALQGVHQAAVEKPVDAASRLGFPAEKAALIKDSHRRFESLISAAFSAGNPSRLAASTGFSTAA